MLCHIISSEVNYLIIGSNGRVVLKRKNDWQDIGEIERFFSGRQQGKSGISTIKPQSNIARIGDSVFFTRFHDWSLARFDFQADPAILPPVTKIHDSVHEIAVSDFHPVIYGLNKKQNKLLVISPLGQLLISKRHETTRVLVSHSTLAVGQKYLALAKQVHISKKQFSVLEVFSTKLSKTSRLIFKDMGQRCTFLSMKVVDTQEWIVYVGDSSKMVLMVIRGGNPMMIRRFSGFEGFLMTIICSVYPLKNRPEFVISGQRKLNNQEIQGFCQVLKLNY